MTAPKIHHYAVGDVVEYRAPRWPRIVQVVGVGKSQYVTLDLPAIRVTVSIDKVKRCKIQHPEVADEAV